MLQSEIIHHLDCNKLNNRIENLLVLTKDIHAKLHFWIDTGAFICESYKWNGMNSENSKVITPTYCEICGLTLQTKQRKYCSLECFHKSNMPSKEELDNDIKTMSYIKIGKKYNVSDNTMRKWARKYGLL